MSERIKGFTIELDLDSIQVDSGLKDMKASMRQMNSEIRRNMSAFDYGEKSLEKYGAQLDGLNKKLELQEKATESARKRYEKMVDEHGEGSRQAQEAAAAYNNEAATLNNLERHIGKVTDEMKAFKREQEIQSSTMWKTGDALEGFGDGLGKVSDKARQVGGNLTKYITLPAVGVVTAVGGITAAFGWGRLKSVDAAQAQLKGLGYEVEVVERISDQLAVALEGGMLTMGEATSAAATAMASGVKEGKELQRYIQILDGTVAGSTGTFQEMEQIFGRIVDQGNMTRNEFDMIAQRMPGFSKAVQENMNISSDEMYEMLRNGKITTDQFLDIMEDFSGDMATEYAKSWDGMTANTKAYIGIIGENLLGGVFEQSKESIAEFIEILSSDKMISWAEDMGQKIGKMFTIIVDKVKDGITWFRNLSSSQQEMVVKFGALVIAAGPLITGLGLFGGLVAKISSGLGGFLKVLAPITKGFGLFSGVATKTTGAVATTGKSVGLLSRIFTMLTGPVGIVIGVISLLVAGFTTAYKRSETFRNFVHDLGVKLKEVFQGLVEWVRPGLDAIKDFFVEIKERFNEFWSSEGQTFIQAWQNIGSFISEVATNIWTGIKWAFEQIKWIIADYVMPVVEFIIKQVWGNIKGIITGALDVIMGAVKIFSGLFTGDFSKMWEGVKQLFFGAIKVVWNWLELQFIGRILKGVGGLATGFWGHIKNLWKWVKDTFTNSIGAVYNSVSNSFVGRIVSAIIDFVKNFRTNISNMWNSVKTNFTNKISEIRTSIENSFVGRMLTSVTKLKDDFIKLAGDMWTGVKKKFDDIVDGAKALPGRIGDGITSMKDKAVSGMKSVGNSLIEWAGKPFNKVVDGVNWITGKLLPSRELIGHWAYPQYAKGTSSEGHPGGHFIAGEKGKELVKLPDGRSFLTPDRATFFPNMPKGTHVIPNKHTEQILKSDLPHYKDGTGLWEDIKGVGRNIWDGAKKAWDFIGDVWDYASNPSKLVNLVMDKISIIKDQAQIPTEMVKAGFNYVKTKPIEYVKGLFKKADGGGGKPAFGWPITSQFGYRMHPIHRTPRLHAGVDFGAPMGTPVPSQTGGTVSFAGWGPGGFGNLVKVKQGAWEMFYAHLSKILVSAGQAVTKGQILGNVGSTGASTGPHLHYEARKNGTPVNPLSLKGFKTGGLIKSKMMAMLGEDGEEMVIPLAKNRRTDAMKLLALAAKKIGVDGGSYDRPSGISGSNTNNNHYLEAVVDKLTQQVQLLTELVISNQQIADKPVLSEGDIKRSYDKLDQKEASKHGIFRGKPGGAY